MALDYRDYEELEDEAMEESLRTKKKPKKKKKSWKELNANDQTNRNKKTGKLWTNHPNRI